MGLLVQTLINKGQTLAAEVVPPLRVKFWKILGRNISDYAYIVYFSFLSYDLAAFVDVIKGIDKGVNNFSFTGKELSTTLIIILFSIIFHLGAYMHTVIIKSNSTNKPLTLMHLFYISVGTALMIYMRF